MAAEALGILFRQGWSPNQVVKNLLMCINFIFKVRLFEDAQIFCLLGQASVGITRLFPLCRLKSKPIRPHDVYLVTSNHNRSIPTHTAKQLQEQPHIYLDFRDEQHYKTTRKRKEADIFNTNICLLVFANEMRVKKLKVKIGDSWPIVPLVGGW